MSYSDDLDWLARNVHEWKEGKIECIPMSPYKVESVVWSSMSPCEGWITKDQWLARRAELQNKPSWNDFRESAKFMAQDSDGAWRAFEIEPTAQSLIWNAKRGWRGYAYEDIADNRGEVLGDWRDTLEQRPADMSEAAATDRLKEATQNVLAAVPALKDEKYRFEWELKPVDVHKNQEEIDMSAERVQKSAESIHDWHERGELPPVGIECEIDLGASWKHCFIVGFDSDNRIVVETNPCKFMVADGCTFRPIRTERDELVDIIASNGFLGRDGEACYLIADAIISAGFERNGGKS